MGDVEDRDEHAVFFVHLIKGKLTVTRLLLVIIRIAEVEDLQGCGPIT